MAEPKEQGREKRAKLRDLLNEYLERYPKDDEIELFLDWFKKRFGRNLLAVIFFGSCLSEKTKSATSFKDFIVVVDKYRGTGLNPFAWLSHWILPPDLFHLELEGSGKKRECKYYLVSLAQLVQAVGEKAKDLYLMGRLSKRIALIYFRGEKEREEILLVQARAMERASELSLALLEEFDLEGFIKAILRLSYLAETRLEDERKVESLYQAHQEFYQAVYGVVLDSLVERGWVERKEEGRYKVRNSPLTRQELEEFLVKSRKRFKARWPKMILTVDNWLEQLLGKLERTYGIKLEIPAWERPIILITGWRHYFRFKREGKIHEHRPGE